MAMLSVAVLGQVTLAWQAPAENVDGTPLTDLLGYHIYYGQHSGDYTTKVAVTDPKATELQLTLPSGSYYFAMTALDEAGDESDYSNEVIRVVD